MYSKESFEAVLKFYEDHPSHDEWEECLAIALQIARHLPDELFDWIETELHRVFGEF